MKPNTNMVLIAVAGMLMMGSVALAGGPHGRYGGSYDNHDRRGGSNWSVSIGFGWSNYRSPNYYPRYYPPVIYAPRPVYYAPPPVVYCPPPVVYSPPPVVYSRPVYVSPPVVYVPAPVYAPPPVVYYPPAQCSEYTTSRVEFYYRR